MDIQTFCRLLAGILVAFQKIISYWQSPLKFSYRFPQLHKGAVHCMVNLFFVHFFFAIFLCELSSFLRISLQLHIPGEKLQLLYRDVDGPSYRSTMFCSKRLFFPFESDTWPNPGNYKQRCEQEHYHEIKLSKDCMFFKPRKPVVLSA